MSVNGTLPDQYRNFPLVSDCVALLFIAYHKVCPVAACVYYLNRRLSPDEILVTFVLLNDNRHHQQNVFSNNGLCVTVFLFDVNIGDGWYNWN